MTYTRAQLVSILMEPVAGNGLISLAHQLIATQANQKNGACAPPTVQTAIDQANTLIDGLVIPPIGVGFLNPAVTSGLVMTLTQYNEGLSPGGPPHCDTPSEEPSMALARIGILVVDVQDLAIVPITLAMLQNSSYPGYAYDEIDFIGSNSSMARVVLPKPDDVDEAFGIVIENHTNANDLEISNDPALGETLSLQAFKTSEASLEEEIQDNAATTVMYRTRVVSKPAGVFRVPGFTKT